MKKWWPAVLIPVFAIALLGLRPAVREATFAPPRNTAYSSTRAVTALRIDSQDTLWAQATGGTLRYQSGTWTKFTTPPAEYTSLPLTSPSWRGQPVKATLDGVQLGGKASTTIAMPPSVGTHISAVLPRSGELWAALFGDGLWSWDGRRWARPALAVPAAAREITALGQSRDGRTVWLGTRRAGIWSCSGGVWRQHLQPDEPFATNVQYLQSFRGALWASTLEDGLVMRDAAGWKHFDSSVLSSNAPRQMAVFQNRLYVRHSNEVVDSIDGAHWRKNVFPALPRKQIISLAADAGRLYLGEWGGWSEWDGAAFTHHLRISELQIVPLLQIFPDSKTGALWLGTENRGLFRWDASSAKLQQFDERDGLPDDWITGLNRSGKTLFAGTFSGGLAWREDGQARWQAAPELNRRGITGITEDGAGGAFIATRFGLYQRGAQGALRRRDDLLASGEREIQCLLITREGLWVGTRNAIVFRSRGTLDKPGT